MNLSNWLWGGRVKQPKIDRWLELFDEKDKSNALSLLSQFMFYDLKEVRQVLKSMYKDMFLAPLIQKARKEVIKSYKLEDYNSYLRSQIKATKFLGVGNPSESSSLILYFFRQVNDLPKDSFINASDLLDYVKEGESLSVKLKDESINRLIFIDDLSGSGDQAKRNLKSTIETIRKLDTENRIEINYYTIFSTSDAINKLTDSKTDEDIPLFDNVEQVFELDDSYKVFSKTTRYLQQTGSIATFEKSCREKYHAKCKPDDLGDGDCGYGDSQLLLGFFYNVPNNTLPIFWSESDEWLPIFKRYSKKYKMGI